MAKIIKNKPKFNFWLDALLGAGFLLTLATGDELTVLHEWIGIGLGTLIITHIVMHWKWLVSTTKRLFGKMPTRTRINYVLNFGVAGAFLLSFVTGLVMSNPLWGGLGTSGIVSGIHEAASGLTVVMALAHVAIHYKWILSGIKRFILKVTPKRRRRNVAPTKAVLSQA